MTFICCLLPTEQRSPVGISSQRSHQPRTAFTDDTWLFAWLKHEGEKMVSTVLYQMTTALRDRGSYYLPPTFRFTTEP
ncbi:MAG: hypothetical protein HWQ38_37775 [Nostoc sp. NMS7]|uniref:hypothetical protein n=1 Tax=Nostoc sp. NMS7 TaxID=2815391 RepID=UPI0026001B1D|nr:hypothetical protein [Nostoc sp. NMS7]MBN3951907.1 hypothetical protein [Nostoc sp. NMS7]